MTTAKKGNKALSVQLIKAINQGCVKPALFWYNRFHNTLKEMIFILKPYNSCVANCMIKNKIQGMWMKQGLPCDWSKIS
jgi:hypothetical protein